MTEGPNLFRDNFTARQHHSRRQLALSACTEVLQFSIYPEVRRKLLETTAMLSKAQQYRIARMKSLRGHFVDLPRKVRIYG